jgi:hypothetical protein
VRACVRACTHEATFTDAVATELIAGRWHWHRSFCGCSTSSFILANIIIINPLVEEKFGTKKREGIEKQSDFKLVEYGCSKCDDVTAKIYLYSHIYIQFCGSSAVVCLLETCFRCHKFDIHWKIIEQ